MNKFLAMSLVLVMAGSLTACNQANRGELGADQTTAEQQELASGQSEVRGEAADLNSLDEGQPLDYYLSEFERQGFDVADVQRRDQEWIYDLRRANGQERYLVMLEQGDNNRIDNVDVEERKRIDVTQNPEAKKLVDRLNQMKAGKQPSEYFTELNQVGMVTDYKLDEDNAKITVLGQPGGTQQAGQAQVREAARDQDLEFHVDMEVNPQTNRVETIRVDDNVWGFGG